MKLQRQQIEQLIGQQASEWIEVLKTANLQERAAFVAWLKESRSHVKEFLEMVAIDRELNHIDPEHRHDLGALVTRIAPHSVPLGNMPTQRMGTQQKRWRLGRRQWGATFAAAAALLSLSIWLMLDSPSQWQAFSTAVGEQRAIALADASVVHLNALTQIQVRLSGTARDIRLVQGEAMFKVAHDARRPFRVHTRRATVQAVGTQFNVYDRVDGTQVSVLEGRVRITAERRPAGGAAAPEEKPATRSLGAGEEAQVGLNGQIRSSARGDIANAVAWRQRRLVFKKATLENVVLEFNRYNRSLQLRLESIDEGSRHYSGVFDADDPESLAQLLSRERDLSIERRAGEIVIRPRVQRGGSEIEARPASVVGSRAPQPW